MLSTESQTVTSLGLNDDRYVAGMDTDLTRGRVAPSQQ